MTSDSDRVTLVELLGSVYLTERQKDALARVLGVRRRTTRLVSVTRTVDDATAASELRAFLEGTGAE